MENCHTWIIISMWQNDLHTNTSRSMWPILYGLMIKMLQYKMYPAGELAVLRQLLLTNIVKTTKRLLIWSSQSGKWKLFRLYLDFLRSADTQETAVRENIQKARHTIYNLMGSGLHGHNGLDPETLIQLLNIYILLVLVYGLKVVLPKATLIKKLERNHKQFIKHIVYPHSCSRSSRVHSNWYHPYWGHDS